MSLRRPWAKRALYALYRKIRPIPPLARGRIDSGDETWSEGELPARGSCILVADGLGTASTGPNFDKLKAQPWISTVGPAIRVSRDVTVRGFSYSYHGKHYIGPWTNTSLSDAAAYRRVREYEPRVGLQQTILTFSLAGPLFVFGLAEWLRRNPILDARSMVRGLVLLQPAFHLGPEVADAARSFADTPTVDWSLPWAIEEYMSSPTMFSVRIASALALIRRAQIPIILVYWPDDEFVYYDTGLLNAWGFSPHESIVIAHDFTLDKDDPFEQHLAVAAHEATFAALRRALTML